MSTAAAPGARALPVLDPVEAPELGAPVHRDLCTDCGLSRTAEPARCGRACQFIAPRYPALERQVHGRARDAGLPDELHFGPFLEMLRVRLAPGLDGAQWTGVTTRIGERLLETGAVDAVLATASDPDDAWRPRPVLVTEPEGMARCRGMKMGYSPVLALLEVAAERGYRRVAVIGIPCQVHALRAIETDLGLERLYVVGIPCSDNTTTERFHQFLALLAEDPDEITYLEFRTDYVVELRFRDGRVREVPFLSLPTSQLPDDFFPVTCRACVDYANALADVTVGYMGGDGDQWLIVRNERGEELVALLGDELERRPLVSRGRRAGAVSAFRSAVERSTSGLPARRAPRWARPLVHQAMRRFGPKGLEFARTRVEMKLIEAILVLRERHPRRVHRMVPEHAWPLVAPYGIEPDPGERYGPGERES